MTKRALITGITGYLSLAILIVETLAVGLALWPPVGSVVRGLGGVLPGWRLPALGALGGMIVPAVLYVVIVSSGDAGDTAVPRATTEAPAAPKVSTRCFQAWA